MDDCSLSGFLVLLSLMASLGGCLSEGNESFGSAHVVSSTIASSESKECIDGKRVFDELLVDPGKFYGEEVYVVANVVGTDMQRDRGSTSYKDLRLAGHDNNINLKWISQFHYPHRVHFEPYPENPLVTEGDNIVALFDLDLSDEVHEHLDRHPQFDGEYDKSDFKSLAENLLSKVRVYRDNKTWQWLILNDAFQNFTKIDCSK
ncbi:hypothetical protein ACFLRF_04145 [Candidatus Altiarchaeota archaeon]